MKKQPHLTKYHLWGVWHLISIEQQYEHEWITMHEFPPGDYIWRFIPHGIVSSESSHALPFVADYRCYPEGIIHIKGHDYNHGERHAVIDDWYGVDWLSNDEIVLYNCDEDAELCPLRLTFRRTDRN